IELIEETGIFSKAKELEINSYFHETLTDNVPLALAINTEKARSELIISPVLVELRKIHKKKISLFSGIEFNVDKAKDLSGFCDFILSNSPEQLFLKFPIIVIVEAKNENIMTGLGQCIAEMIASKIFNEKEGNITTKIYGSVTTGNLWKFLKLEDNRVFIDMDDYGIKDLGIILGILSEMIEQKV
ncbi:MAG: hypothetical protein GY870_03315, partial [archaeon]|nr:hypothetical protein [archaeon]